MTPTLFLTCFGIYIVGVTIFGAWVARRKQSGEDFLLGGRSLPLYLTLGTTIATIIGTGSSMGSVGKGYSSGWMGSFFGLGSFIGVVLTAILFAPARRHRFMTMAEELSSYVGGSKVVSNLVAVFTYMACVGWLGAHILGGGRYLQYVTQIDLSYALVLIALGFAVYSTIGGYRAVVWTDTIQAVVLFGGFVLTAFFAFRSIGGIEGLRETSAILSEQTATSTAGPSSLPGISLVITIAVSILATPSFRQRIYSGNSVGDIRKAFYLSAVLAISFALLPSIIGMAAYHHNPDLANADLAFPFMATEMLPVSIGVLTLLAGLSATMSSASSDAIAGVTIAVRDIFELIFKRLPRPENVVLFSRIGLAATTGLALMMAFSADNILGYIRDMVSLFITGMCVCAILGRLWARYNSGGAIASLIGAFVTALAFRLQPDWTAYWGGSIIPALTVSALAGVIVTLITPPDALSQEDIIAILDKRRATMEEPGGSSA
ncbi:MAG: sodium:solute symporter family protein [Opitutaceae bacterium]|jgi:solute:Na+ symporter, SSS family|nr:sodium:solute symporter family protein [Opitutaceae bacterium]